MKRILLVLAITAATFGSAHAQDEWKAELGEELVELRDGKMVIEDFMIFKITVPGYEEVSYQVKTYAEAPAEGLISRDVFVSLSSVVVFELLYRAFAETYQVSAEVFLESVETHDLESPIGRPDLELNLFSSDEGLQIEVVNTGTGQSNRHTTTWKEFFDE